MSKLSWDYDQHAGCEVAEVNATTRIKAVQDPDASNPFKDDDCHWPIAVYGGRDNGTTTYDDNMDRDILDPIQYFSDDLLIHLQVNIAKLLNYSGVKDWMDSAGSDEPVAYCTNADALRGAWAWEVEHEIRESDKLDIVRSLYELLDIPATTVTCTGYSQGDQVEVLVVAPPETRAKFGCETVSADNLIDTGKLYGWWAFGDCFGYVIEVATLDEDGEVESWDETDSCWGYYGTDHKASGLEEAALEALPDGAFMELAHAA